MTTRLGTGIVTALLACAIPGSLPAHADIPPPVRAVVEFASAATYVAHPGETTGITYDPASVPVGSRLEVTEALNKKGGMTVDLHADGLLPGRHYRAYIHTRGCTDDPAAAGPRLQNGPSHDSYEANEVWFTLDTDPAGSASATTMKYWGIAAGRTAGSVVVQYDTGTTAAGCASVPFERMGAW